MGIWCFRSATEAPFSLLQIRVHQLGEAAIDKKFRPETIARIVGGEEKHCLSHFLRRSAPPQGNGFCYGRGKLCGCNARRTAFTGDDWGVRHAWPQYIYADASRKQLNRERACQ